MELRQNTQLISVANAAKRKIEMQKRIKNIQLKPGDYIKCAFQEDDIVEHIWLKIKEMHIGFIVAIVDNEPLFLKDTKLGQMKIIFKRDIEQIL